MTQPIILSVVGHTNTGKTSLVRTLLRNTGFGEVLDSAGTTRHVETAQILIGRQAVIELRDTPGLEDSVALAEQLHPVENTDMSSRAALQAFVDAGVKHPEFEQEIKVLKQALHCDALLYVIDCREAVFAKYHQEIQILKKAARPILPVLNFINSDPAQLEQWRQALAEHGLHAQVSFDTVAFDFEAEHRLYQKLQTLLEAHYHTLQNLIDHRRQQWLELQSTCTQRIARCLLDCAKLRVATQDNSVEPESIEYLRSHARALEQACLTDVLELMQFSATDVALTQLPVSNGQWQLDLFSPQTLKSLGLDTASAAATGAAIGAGVDILFAGISLGAATATGAALGAAWHGSKRFGKDLWQKLQGRTFIGLDDTTLDAILLRQLWLLRTFLQRGHAAQTQATMSNEKTPKLPPGWPGQRQALRRAGAGTGQDQEQVVTEVGDWLQKALAKR